MRIIPGAISDQPVPAGSERSAGAGGADELLPAGEHGGGILRLGRTASFPVCHAHRIPNGTLRLPKTKDSPAARNHGTSRPSALIADALGAAELKGVFPKWAGAVLPDRGGGPSGIDGWTAGVDASCYGVNLAFSRLWGLACFSAGVGHGRSVCRPFSTRLEAVPIRSSFRGEAPSLSGSDAGLKCLREN
jgi:hypothetical protein